MTTSRERFGREVLGPMLADFDLRLWMLQSTIARPDDAMLLFCARGGLRMRLAYETFLEATGLPASVPSASLMVSRISALRAALSARMDAGAPFGPAARASMHYELRSLTLREAVRSVSGVEAPDAPETRFEVKAFEAWLASPEGAAARAAVLEQGRLFLRHLRSLLGGRTTAVLVDTGLYGTTGQLVAEACPELRVSTALLARTHRPLRGAPDVPAIGLLASARGYSPVAPRTAMLRYWHFVEWVLEPELPSVRHFRAEGEGVVADLQIDGWESRVPAPPGHPFAGALEHLAALDSAPGRTVPASAGRAWRRFRRAVVWPREADVDALAVGLRSHDFGRTDTWSARAWAGPVAALRGTTMWREGEIARSRTPWRWPLLALIETAYAGRALWRALR